MTELIRQWIVAVTCAAMAAAVLQALLPRGGSGAAARLAGGLLVLIATVQPLLELDYDSLAQSLAQLRLGQDVSAQARGQVNSDVLEELIEEQTRSYILDKAEQLGMSCQVSVTCRRGEEGIPFPSAVSVSGAFTQEQADRLAQIIEGDLAVPVEDQTYQREVERWS